MEKVKNDECCCFCLDMVTDLDATGRDKEEEKKTKEEVASFFWLSPPHFEEEVEEVEGRWECPAALLEEEGEWEERLGKTSLRCAVDGGKGTTPISSVSHARRPALTRSCFSGPLRRFHRHEFNPAF